MANQGAPWQGIDPEEYELKRMIEEALGLPPGSVEFGLEDYRRIRHLLGEIITPRGNHHAPLDSLLRDAERINVALKKAPLLRDVLGGVLGPDLLRITQKTQEDLYSILESGIDVLEDLAENVILGAMGGSDPEKGVGNER